MDAITEIIYIKSYLGIATSEEIDSWVDDLIMKDVTYNYEIHDLITSDIWVKRKRLQDIIEKYENLNIGNTFDTKITEEIAINLFVKYKNKEISPMELCQFVCTVDTLVIDHSLCLPFWLGDLWNCCDCCDDSWTHDDNPHIKEEINRILKNK